MFLVRLNLVHRKYRMFLGIFTMIRVLDTVN